MRKRDEQRFWGRPQKDDLGIYKDQEEIRLRDNGIKGTDDLLAWMQFYHPQGDPYA